MVDRILAQGDDRVIEGYMEVEAPLLSGFKLGDISLAEELTVNGSYRYTHYSSYGSDSTWRLLFNYAVNPALRVRTALGTSFRAPALYHLNLGDQTSYLAGRTDPCSEFRNANSGPGPGSNVYRNCAALESQGIIPPGFASEDIVRIHGGNPGLEAETSNSWTLGFVVTPDLAGLHANPSWRGEAAARFRRRDFTFAWYADYIGSTRERPIYDEFGDGSVTNVTRAGAGFLPRSTITFRRPSDFQVTKASALIMKCSQMLMI